MSAQLSFDFPRRYVRVQCSGLDRRTGEPRQWNHIVEESWASELAKQIMDRTPGVHAEVRK